MAYDAEAAFRKPVKPDNGFSEDGDYYCRVGTTSIKASKDGSSEWISVPVTIAEGDMGGEEAEVTYFYQSRGEFSELTIEKLKKVSDFINPKLRESSINFMAWIDSLANLLAGRQIKVNQHTKNNTAWLTILEVTPLGEIKNQQFNDAPPMTESDIPF